MFTVLPDAAEKPENDEVGGGGGERRDDAADGAHQEGGDQGLAAADVVGQTAPQAASNQKSLEKGNKY